MFDICAAQIKDVTTLAERLGQWVAAHPEKVDRSL
jgi:hypothetical protein